VMMWKRMMHLQVLDQNLKVTLVWLFLILVLMNKLLLKIRQRMCTMNKNCQVNVLIKNNEIINSIGEATDGNDDTSKDPDHMIDAENTIIDEPDRTLDSIEINIQATEGARAYP
jgi:hypothetical protein